MFKSFKYRLFVQATTAILLIGVALPTGLCAKQLMDYCITGQDEYQFEAAMEHDDCHPPENEKAEQNERTQHICEGELICICNIELAPLSEQFWTMQKTVVSGALAVVTTVESETPRDIFHSTTTSEGTYSTPPIFLLNSTFLN